MLTETFNQNINKKHVKISSETLDGKRTSNLSDPNPEVFDGSESSVDSEVLIDITVGGERENPEISRSDNNDDSKAGTNGTKSIMVPAETSSSSSSSESSSNGFFQARKVKFAESSASKSASKEEHSDVSRERYIKSEAGNNSPVPASTSQIYNSNHGHMSMSPTVIPPVQVMDRSSEYDPYRIPSSVFASNTNAMDWTNDSNESLFSIQIGNHSLSRDRLFMSHELGKSGELTKSGELNMFHPLPSVLMEDRDSGRKSVEMEDSQTTEMSGEDFKLEESLDKNKNKVKNSHPAVSYNTHGNGTGAHSSALPMEKKRTWPFCYGFCCSWAFCCFKLPSCCLSWPSCSCLKCCWALCCCWHASPALTEAERINSMKTESPQQQSSNKSSEMTSNSTSNCCNWCQCFSWLSCTSCCPQTDSPRQQSYDKASEKTSSSTSNCCSWFQCCSGCCCSWGTCCSQTDSPRQQSYDKASEETSSSTSNCCSWFQCCSGSLCSWGKCCCLQTGSPRQQSYDKASEKSLSSTSNCCSWFQCFSGSCCSWDKCCSCSQTNSPRQQFYDKTSEKTSSSTSNCCGCFQCCSGSCCSWGKCCCCSQTDSPRQQSYDKASERTSSSTSNCWNWFQCCSGSSCSWGKYCCCCCHCC